MPSALFFQAFAVLIILVLLIVWIGSKPGEYPVWLGKKAIKVQAKVVAINQLQHTTKSFEILTGYQVECEWLNPYDFSSQIFVSEILHEVPGLKKDDQVDVYLSTKELGKYYVKIRGQRAEGRG